jgi:hypothetical protein
MFDISGIFSQNPETTSECSDRVPEAQQGKWCSPDRWCGRVHCCPATVNGDEIRENPLPVRWEGAESRKIREPGDLPGTACEPIEGEVPGGSAPSQDEPRERVVNRMDGIADSPWWVGFCLGIRITLGLVLRELFGRQKGSSVNTGRPYGEPCSA